MQLKIAGYHQQHHNHHDGSIKTRRLAFWARFRTVSITIPGNSNRGHLLGDRDFKRKHLRPLVLIK